MTILNTILGFIFGGRCLGCGMEGKDLCLECLAVAPGAERESASWVFPIYDYRHPPIKRAVRLLKYKNRKNIAETIAEAMHGRIMEEISDLARSENFRGPLLVPIPLSRQRMRERGYNQTALICEKLAELSVGALEIAESALIKVKETEHQARAKNRAERLGNILGTFSVRDADIIKNKNIILIDDVVTTGATLEEAKKVLEEAGARRVIAFTLAH